MYENMGRNQQKDVKQNEEFVSVCIGGVRLVPTYESDGKRRTFPTGVAFLTFSGIAPRLVTEA